MPDGSFLYTATADGITYREGDPAAEAKRMEWLETYLQHNDMCPNGYAITDRIASVQNKPLIGTTVFDIRYTGECR